MRVKPFAALRPPKNLVEQVASPPYDVLDSAEALAIAGDKSLLHITKPEIDFSPMLPDNDPKVYRKAIDNFAEWQKMCMRRLWASVPSMALCCARIATTMLRD